MSVHPGCVVSYVGPGWMGRALEKTHGRALCTEVDQGIATVRYPNGGELFGPVAHFAVWVDLLEQLYLAASGGPETEAV